MTPQNLAGKTELAETYSKRRLNSKLAQYSWTATDQCCFLMKIHRVLPAFGWTSLIVVFAVLFETRFWAWNTLDLEKDVGRPLWKNKQSKMEESGGCSAKRGCTVHRDAQWFGLAPLHIFHLRWSYHVHGSRHFLTNFHFLSVFVLSDKKNLVLVEHKLKGSANASFGRNRQRFEGKK